MRRRQMDSARKYKREFKEIQDFDPDWRLQCFYFFLTWMKNDDVDEISLVVIAFLEEWIISSEESS